MLASAYVFTAEVRWEQFEKNPNAFCVTRMRAMASKIQENPAENLLIRKLHGAQNKQFNSQVIKNNVYLRIIQSRWLSII